MKKQKRITKVQFSGSGHYKVSVIRYGKEYTATITDMQAIDDYKYGKVSAAIRLYDYVCRKNNLN